MSKLPIVSGKEMCKILESIGFEKVHQKGSHARYAHSDGRRTVVPVHGNEDLGRSLISAILKEIDLGKDEYLKILKKK